MGWWIELSLLWAKNSSQTIHESALVKTLSSKTIVVLLFAVTIHELSIEKKVIDLAVNDSSVFKNVSVVLKRVSHNDNITLLNQGKIWGGKKVNK